MFQEYLRAPSTNLRCFILIMLFSFSKYLQRGLDSFWRWHFVGSSSSTSSSPSPSFFSSRCPLLKRPWFFFAFRISQDLECHTGVISAYFTSDEAKECTLLLQSSLKRFGKQLPTRPLTLLLHAGVRLRRRHSWIRLPVLPLTCTAALSLTHWQSALYVWKWAVITTICVPSLLFYKGLFPMGCLFPSTLPSFSNSRCSLLFHMHLRWIRPPSFHSSSKAISLIYSPAHADDRNRCSINYAWNYIPSCSASPHHRQPSALPVSGKKKTKKHTDHVSAENFKSWLCHHAEYTD